MRSVAVGVDFGSQFVKLAKLRRRGQHLVVERLLKFARTEMVASELRAAGLGASGAVVGIPGRGAILRYTSVPPVPAYRLKMIVEYEIGELAAKSGEAVSSDYKVLNLPRDISQDFSVMVAMSKDEFVRDYMLQLGSAGIDVAVALPAPVALYNTFLALGVYEEDTNYLLVDIGATNVDMAIVGGKELFYARSIGRGADDFTEAVSEVLRVGFPEAERIKCSEGAILIAGWSSDRQKNISDALRGAADRLYSTLSSSINFGLRQINQKDLKVDKICLFGGGSNIPGLPEYLASLFGKEVIAHQLRTLMHGQEGPAGRIRLEDSLPDLDVSGASEQLREFATAIGLAASKLDVSFWSMDLMPAEEKKKRLFRERTVFLYAAGAVLALFLLVRLITAGTESTKVQERCDVLQSRLEEAKQRQFALRKITKENDQVTSALRHAADVTERGTFLTELLFLIRKVEITPKGIKIDEIVLRNYPAEDESARKEISVLIRGRVMSQTGDEYDIVRRFSDQLEKAKIVKSAAIDPSLTRRAREEFNFEIVVTSGRVK